MCFSVPGDSKVNTMSTQAAVAEIEKLTVVVTLSCRPLLSYSDSRETVQFNDSIGAVAGEGAPRQLFGGVGELFLTANSSNKV